MMPHYLEHEILERGLNVVKEKDKNDERKIVPFPYEIKNIDPELNSELMTYFTGEKTGFVQVGPKNYFFPSGYIKEAENFYNFEFRPDDVIVNTFPRSGTTWTQEMVWLLCNDLNYKKASETPLTARFPFLEFSCFVHKELEKQFHDENIHKPENYQEIQNLAHPAWKSLSLCKERRFIKTHLPFSLLPPDLTKVGCKVIYLARNPKDVAVSFYHLNRSARTQGYTGDFPRYWDYFERNLQPWTPYWEHIKEGWSKRHEENVLFMFYEDMNKNLKSGIEKIASFLDQSYTKAELETLEEHLKIENFRKNTSVNGVELIDLGVMLKTEARFIRKGKNNGWRDYFDEELERRVNKWTEENLKDTDIEFPRS